MEDFLKYIFQDIFRAQITLNSKHLTLRYAGSGPGEIGIELEGASFLDRWTSVGGKWIERVDIQEGVKY